MFINALAVPFLFLSPVLGAPGTVDFIGNHLTVLDLAPDGATTCGRFTGTPGTLSTFLSVEASVVALAGTVNVLVGFDESALRSTLSSGAVESGGSFSFVQQNLEKTSETLFFCFSTYSQQGADFHVTAGVSLASLPRFARADIPLADGVPVVWRLDNLGRRSIAFTSQASTEEISVSIVPLSGDVDVRVFSCSDEHELLLASETVGPEVFRLKSPPKCVRYFVFVPYGKAESEFSFSATPKGTNMQLIPGVDAAETSESLKVSALLNVATDAVFFAKEISGNPFSHFQIRLGDVVYRPGSDGRVELSADEIARSTANTGNFRALMEAVSVAETEPSTILVGFTGASEETTLEDGVYFSSVVESGDRRFQDFRFWVSHEATFVDILVEASEDGSGVAIFADVTRRSRDPRGYRWNSMNGDNVLHFSTTGAVGRLPLPCRGCFLYLSVKSCVVTAGVCESNGERSKFSIFASSTGTILAHLGKPLLFTVAGSIEAKTVRVYHRASEAEAELLVHVWQSSEADAPLPVAVTAAGESLAACSEGRKSPACHFVLGPGSGTFSDLTFSANPKAIASTNVWVWVQSSVDAIWLRNHETFHLSSLTGGDTRKFKFAVRPSSEALVIQQPPICDLSVLFDGEPISPLSSPSTSRRVVRLMNAAAAVTTAFITVKCPEGTTESMQLTVASTAVENALRVNYPAVNFALAPSENSSKQWLVGYRDEEQWLAAVTLFGGTHGLTVTVCIAERCSDFSEDTSCSVQGFGRETVVVQANRPANSVGGSASPILGQLQVTGLSPPIVFGQWLDVSQRQSHIYRIPPDVRVTVDPPSATVKFSTSPNGPWSSTQQTFMQTESARLRLDKAVTLRLNEWAENPFWVKSPVSTHTAVVVESCDLDGKVYDGQGKEISSRPLSASDWPMLSGLHSDGNFRVGLFAQQESIQLEHRGQFLLFRLPNNSLTSSYRAVASKDERSPASACAVERHPVVTGAWRTCTKSAKMCVVDLPLDTADRCFALTVQEGGHSSHRFAVIHTCGVSATWVGRMNDLVVLIGRTCLFLSLVVLVLVSLGTGDVVSLLWRALARLVQWTKSCRGMRKKKVEDPLLCEQNRLELSDFARKSELQEHQNPATPFYRRIGRDV